MKGKLKINLLNSVVNFKKFKRLIYQIFELVKNVVYYNIIYFFNLYTHKFMFYLIFQSRKHYFRNKLETYFMIQKNPF